MSEIIFEVRKDETDGGFTAAALGGEEDTMSDWQLKRSGGKRGIVKVVGHD
jgi:hypothetical protein